MCVYISLYINIISEMFTLCTHVLHWPDLSIHLCYVPGFITWSLSSNETHCYATLSVSEGCRSDPHSWATKLYWKPSYYYFLSHLAWPFQKVTETHWGRDAGSKHGLTHTELFTYVHTRCESTDCCLIHTPALSINSTHTNMSLRLL